MTTLLEDESYTVDESVSLLCALCDRIKGLW